MYDPSTWDRIQTIDACKSSDDHRIHTLRVTSSGIALACCYNHCVHVLDHSGTLQKTHGTHGHTAGMFYKPFLCGVGNDGSMLLADCRNNRCQVFHNGEWHVPLLKPPPLVPRGVVVTEHTLYIITDDAELVMYKIK